ncbi:MAG: DUF3347 domain-containing protein [Bacteroidetes bacterium]|nr:DUF3347 domain-containing protein [Bacteroidota bacterium]
MKSIKIFLAITVMLSFTGLNAQIKNAKTDSVKIFGNCGMCKAAIEKAGNKKKIAKVDWNKESKMATITYDAKKTNREEILKRIALSGYDNEKFLAPNDVYAKLPVCCQYKIEVRTEVKKEEAKKDSAKIEMTDDQTNHNHSKMTETKKDVSQLKTVFDNYFAIKDALVKTDGNTASTMAKELQRAIGHVQMDKLSSEEHIAWMKVMKNLAVAAELIADTKDVSQQREYFIALSKNMYLLIKVSKQETPVYYQHCPMANNGKGANWLSKESAIKNPFYGSEMLSCGKTVETIK